EVVFRRYSRVMAEQAELPDLIIADGPSTAIYLGDEQQAIFEFLGAGGPALDKIKLRCENNIYRLARNYRSPAYLVKLCNDFAASCLDINPAHLPQAVTDGTRPEGALQMLPTSDFNLPLAVAAKVRAWRNDLPDKRIAVLTRTNDEAEEVAALMAAHGIENTLVGRNDLFRRVPFKTVYAHLSVIASDHQPSEWARLLYQTRAVRTLSEARSLAVRLDKMNLSPACFIMPERYKEQLSRLDENDKSFLSSMIITQTAKKFYDAYSDLYSHTLSLLDQTEQADSNTLAAECDYAYRYLSQRDFISHIDRWDAVINFIKRTLGGETLSRQLYERLPELRTFNEGDLLTDEPVTVITVHKAKGLEFDNVVLYNASPKNLPHSNDDARVYYVAFSRAKERLAVFHSSKLSAPVASVSHHFDHISPDEVEAMSLLERLHNRPIRRK
ncbi:MAG: ATP-binding domain-containing protein, partial [Muribaculaceae bacterium]|nr:ATP-binding domain-containing protein [Muribaculaceae bacterium]